MVTSFFALLLVKFIFEACDLRVLQFADSVGAKMRTRLCAILGILCKVRFLTFSSLQCRKYRVIMNPEVFAKELAKYPVVRRMDYCKSRTTNGNVSVMFQGCPVSLITAKEYSS